MQKNGEEFVQQVMDVGLLSACFIEDAALQYQLNLTSESRFIKNVKCQPNPCDFKANLFSIVSSRMATAM